MKSDTSEKDEGLTTSSDSEQSDTLSSEGRKSEREFKHQNLWIFCGKTMDKRIIYIFVQILVTLITLVFSMIMTYYTNGEDTVYISLISTIVGNYLPNNLQQIRNNQ